MTLSNNIIADLIDVGNHFPESINEVRKLFTDDSINRLHWKEWNFFCENLNDADLILLFKGLVQVEAELNWIGGSVAGGVWVYKNIEKRNLDNQSELASWSSVITKNPYLKFN